MKKAMCAEAGLFRKLAVAAFLLFVNFFSFAQDLAPSRSLSAANRRTAERFLKIAEDCLAQELWEGALAQAEMGLAYDDGVSDLWYVQAAAKSGQGRARAEVLPLVETALSLGVWIDYNRDGARVLYADLLCDTGRSDEALSALDSAPFIYSADAEFIRMKAYYRLGTADAIANARSKVNSARRIYPSDTRFPRFFFRYEYAMRVASEYASRQDGGDSAQSGATGDAPVQNAAGGVSVQNDDEAFFVQSIANSFIAKMPDYDAGDAELEMYAALFSEGEAQRRMLQAFSARGLAHPLYAAAAVRAGLMGESDAIDYFFEFAADTVPLATLVEFSEAVIEDEARRQFASRLESYGGVLTVGTDGDIEPNMTVRYSRGRPAEISWDKERDGINEWSALCDFGVPVSIAVTEGGAELQYGAYPALATAAYNGDATYRFSDDAYSWSPFSIEADARIRQNLGVDFFVPRVNVDAPALDAAELFAACSECSVNGGERENSVIRFSVLDGEIQSADYYSDGGLYARAVFENGLPLMRALDSDGDGIYETAEFYGNDPQNEMRASEADLRGVSMSLFGNPDRTDVYLRMIQIDSNEDAVFDFSEEYAADGGKTTSWDTDGDGLWDLRYVRQPQPAGGPLVEEAQFYIFPERSLVTITSYDGAPASVVADGIEWNVSAGAGENVYWVGEAGGEDDEAAALDALDGAEQGRSTLVSSGLREILAVRVGGERYLHVVAELEPDLDADGNSSAVGNLGGIIDGANVLINPSLSRDGQNDPPIESERIDVSDAFID